MRQKELYVKYYGFKMNKKQFFITYLLFLIICLSGFLYFTFFPTNPDLLPLPDFFNKQIRFTFANLDSFFLLVFVYTIIEAQYWWNRFTKRQLQIIDNLKEEIEHKNKDITASINYAKRLQTAILPNDSEIKKSFPNSFVYYRPKDIVAGDFYWLSSHNNKTYIAVADCTGHGVPGAMLSVMCNSCLNRSVKQFGMNRPVDILNKTRELLLQEFEKSEEIMSDGMDISLCSIDYDASMLEWAGANNPLLIVHPNSEEIEEIKPDKQPVGYRASLDSFTNHRIDLNKGDKIYLFSDGFQDQFGGEKGKKYMGKAFRKFLVELKDIEIADQYDIIDQEFIGWKGNHEQVDDVCIIGIKL
jgi:serine phosphatase RsbU (regulator of sigma subunit)